MGTATVQAQIGTGTTVSWANAETGAKWSREDSLSGSTAIPIPTSTGTNYSWIKNFALAVTATGTTTMSNRRISMASSPSTGLNLFWKAVAVASYAQAASGTMPATSGSNGATPSGYTLMSTTPTVYDSSSVATSSTGVNGGMAVCVLGVDNTCPTTNAGSSAATPSLTFTYDEA